MNCMTALWRTAAFVVLTAPAMAGDPGFWLLGRGGTQSDRSRVTAFSADASIAAGYSSRSAVNPALGFTWTAASGRHDFGGTPGDMFQTQVCDMTPDASIIVGGTQSRAFRRLAPGVFDYIEPAPGYTRTYAQGVSDDGATVAGWNGSFVDGTPLNQAFVWKESSGRRDLGYLLPDHDYSEAQDVSADGSTVIGFSGYFVYGGYRTFKWTQQTGMVELASYPGAGVGGQAYAISADGRYVTGHANGFSFNSVPTRWNPDGSLTNLDPLGQLFGGFGNAISDDGSVIAGSGHFRGRPASTEALVWVEEGGLEPLTSFAVRHGIRIPDGWYLSSCSAISADGRSFGGQAVGPGFDLQAYVLTVPSPCGGMVVLVVMVRGLTSRRR